MAAKRVDAAVLSISIPYISHKAQTLPLKRIQANCKVLCPIMNRMICLRGASQKFSSFLTRQTLASTNIHHASWRQCANAFSTASPLSLSAKIKQLREATNAPMMECKKALIDPEVDGDIELAIEHLRRQVRL